jgi:hypothetical protein
MNKRSQRLRPMAMNRRNFLSIVLSAGLSGCGENAMRDVTTAFRFMASGVPDVPITRDGINKLPYATISAKIGRRGPRSILVLWTDNNSDLMWLSADDVGIITRHGRVIQTVGLPSTIRHTAFHGIDPVSSGLHRIADTATIRREVEFVVGDTIETAQIDSRFVVEGPRKIVIAEIEFDTILIKESNRSLTTNWSFENFYWVDPVDGFVWQSTQTISRAFGPIEISVLKPAI